MPNQRKSALVEFLTSLGVIAVILAITYLPFVSQITLTGDDWPVIWGGFNRGPQMIATMHTVDRPFMGIVYSIDYRIFGNPAIYWHLYAYFLHVAAAMAFWWLLKQLWPQQARIAPLGMALLLGVYPGFLMTPMASSYQNLLFAVFLGILSLAMTVRAFRSNSKLERSIFTLIAALSGIGAPLLFEWMIGFEGLRLILIWYLLQRDQWLGFWKQIRSLVIQYLPYAVVAFLFLFWRVFLFKNIRAATDVGGLAQNYLARPVYMLSRMIGEIVSGVIDAAFGAWIVPFYNLTNKMDYANLFVLFGVVALGVGLFVFAIRWLKISLDGPAEESGNSAVNTHWTRPAMIIGVLSIIVAILPLIAADRGVELGNTYDRYTLTAKFGVILLVGGLIFSAIKQPKLQIGALAVLLGLSIGTHYANGSYYRDLTQVQQRFWWQFSWRTPDLKNGTVLVPLLDPRYRFQDDFNIWPEANIIYRPKVGNVDLNAQILNQDTARIILWDGKDTRGFRTLDINRDYSKMLLVSYENYTGDDTCIHVLDGENLELSQKEDPLIPLVASKSSIDQIDVNAKPHIPQSVFFGAEPAHTWCYYYEKASLARQKGDWAEVVRLGDEAAQKNYHPTDLVEWMPFLEGYLNSQETANANLIAAQMKADPDMVKSVCMRRSLAPLASTTSLVKSTQPGLDQQAASLLCQ